MMVTASSGRMACLTIATVRSLPSARGSRTPSKRRKPGHHAAVAEPQPRAVDAGPEARLPALVVDDVHGVRRADIGEGSSAGRAAIAASASPVSNGEKCVPKASISSGLSSAGAFST